MKGAEFHEDELVLEGLLGTQRIPYADIERAVVRRSGGVGFFSGGTPIPTTSAEDLVLVLRSGLEVEVGRKLHLTFDGTSDDLHNLAKRIQKEADIHRPPQVIPDEVADEVSKDLEADDRPWWQQG